MPITASQQAPAAEVYGLVTAGPAAVTLEEIKDYLKLEACAEDDLLEFWALAVTQYAEKCTGRELRANTWTLTLDCFPADRIVLRRDRVASITSITYVDENDAQQTVASSVYYLKTLTQTSEVVKDPDEDWPDDLTDREAGIVVNFTTQAADCLELVKAGILRQIAFMSENRGDCPEDMGSVAKLSGAAAFYGKATIVRV